MGNKIWTVLLVWVLIGVAYLIMAVSWGATQELITEASTQVAASANMSQMPGTQEAIDSSPVWFWVIPGFAGMIATVWIVKFSK